MLLNFLIGFSVPLFARRLIKIFPEDAGTSFAYMLTPKRTRIFKNSQHNKKRSVLFFKLLFLCVAYGALFSFGIDILSADVSVFWMTIFAWILCVLMEIDRRTLLLPDVLTVPLIILGFGYACLGDGNITPMESAIGAIFGYFAPVVCSAIVSFFKKDTIGGGDIKILAGLGAWLGLYYLSFAIFISFLVFVCLAIYNKSKVGPYGPAIVIASLISMYLMNVGCFSEHIKY